MVKSFENLQERIWKLVRKYDLEVSEEQVNEISNVLWMLVDDMLDEHLSNHDHTSHDIDLDY